MKKQNYDISIISGNIAMCKYHQGILIKLYLINLNAISYDKYLYINLLIVNIELLTGEVSFYD